MLSAAVSPPRIMPSLMGPVLPPKRAAELPGIASLQVKNLFSDIPDKIYIQGEDLSGIRAATEEALANKVREDIVEGLENAPHALIGLLNGENLGKRMVKVR